MSRTARSTKKKRAPESAAIAATEAGVSEGAIGATATPARRAPRKTATYSIELAAQIAIASRAFTPEAWSVAATRSMSASSVP